MAKRRPSGKPKGLTYELIEPESDIGRPLYRLLEGLVEQHHEDLREARIALAWCTSWKPDVDGRVTLGKCVKASDLHRELAPYDFAILLSRAFFEDGLVTPMQREALIAHELMHAAVKYDVRGEPEYDARGRMIYRIRKHDLEEFSAIAERYGCWKRDLEQFATAIDRARHRDPRFWIGTSALRDAMKAAGCTVPLEVIASWSQAERTEAQEWASLRTELALLPGVQPAEPPAHVQSAAVPEPPVS
jgi:hypothetical protein